MKKFKDKLEKLNMALNFLQDMVEFSNTTDVKLEKLEELNTLYKFDIVDFRSVKDSKFKNEILKDGIVIYNKNN